MLSPKIETERLILRRYNESDIDAFMKYYMMIDCIHISRFLI